MFNKVLWRNMLLIRPGKPGWTPSLFKKCTGFFYMHYTTNRTRRLTSHPKVEAFWLGVLVIDTVDMTGTRNANSADQKHQSLNPMLLTARPSWYLIDTHQFFQTGSRRMSKIFWKSIRWSLNTDLQKVKGQVHSFWNDTFISRVWFPWNIRKVHV